MWKALIGDKGKFLSSHLSVCLSVIQNRWETNEFDTSFSLLFFIFPNKSNKRFTKLPTFKVLFGFLLNSLLINFPHIVTYISNEGKKEWKWNYALYKIQKILMQKCQKTLLYFYVWSVKILNLLKARLLF